MVPMAQFLISVRNDTNDSASAEEVAAIEAPHPDVALRPAASGSKHGNRRVELRPILAA
jgi:hypothetical protein